MSTYIGKKQSPNKNHHRILESWLKTGNEYYSELNNKLRVKLLLKYVSLYTPYTDTTK